MNHFFEKKAAKKLLIMALIATFFINSMTVFADEEDETKAILIKKIESYPVSACKEALVPVFDIELHQFFKFLETNFQNKSANSSLSNIAIARYKDFKANLEDEISRISVGADEDYKILNESYVLCQKLKAEYFDKAKGVLIDHIKKTTAQKTTSIMVEKYQAINSKLRDLNLEISQLYGFFMAFKDKFPGFLKKCLTSG